MDSKTFKSYSEIEWNQFFERLIDPEHILNVNRLFKEIGLVSIGKWLHEDFDTIFNVINSPNLDFHTSFHKKLFQYRKRINNSYNFYLLFKSAYILNRANKSLDRMIIDIYSYLIYSNKKESSIAAKKMLHTLKNRNFYSIAIKQPAKLDALIASLESISADFNVVNQSLVNENSKREIIKKPIPVLNYSVSKKENIIALSDLLELSDYISSSNKFLSIFFVDYRINQNQNEALIWYGSPKALFYLFELLIRKKIIDKMNKHSLELILSLIFSDSNGKPFISDTIIKAKNRNKLAGIPDNDFFSISDSECKSIYNIYSEVFETESF